MHTKTKKNGKTKRKGIQLRSHQSRCLQIKTRSQSLVGRQLGVSQQQGSALERIAGLTADRRPDSRLAGRPLTEHRPSWSALDQAAASGQAESDCYGGSLFYCTLVYVMYVQVAIFLFFAFVSSFRFPFTSIRVTTGASPTALTAGGPWSPTCSG